MIVLNILLGIIFFFVPGICFFKKIDIENIVKSIAISLSFWIVSFWLGLNIVFVFYSTLIASIIFILIKKPKIKIKKKSIIVLVCFTIILLLRLLPFFLNYFPASADMSFHTLTTEAILQNNKLPETYEPFLPIIYGGYPPGFHSLAAYISILTSIPSYSSGLLISNFAYAFLTIAFFVFLRNYFNKKISLIGAIIIIFLPFNPQFFISWGGNPFVLSFGLLIVSASYFERFFKLSNKELVILVLISVASFLTHPMPVLGFFYFYLAIFLIKLIKKWDKKELIKILGIVVLGLIFLSPYIFRFSNLEISENEIEWTKQRQKTKYLSWKGNIKDFAFTMPVFFMKLFGKMFMILALGFLILFYTQKKNLMNISLMLLTLPILILNSTYQILPFSYVLFSERISMFFLLPVGIAVSYFFKKLVNLKFLKLIFKSKYLGRAIQILIIIFIAFLSFQNYVHYINISDTYSMVTDEDIEAFDWIKENINQDSVFLNNYGDAGLWITPLTKRKTITMQIVPSYFDETSFIYEQEPDYVYFGKKKVYDTALKIDDYINNPDYKKVYDKKGVIIFKIK